MILDINQTTLDSIKNPTLREYAGIYVRIERDFIQQIKESGVEFAVEDTNAWFAERLSGLRKKSAIIRNGDKSIYTKRISPSCEACQIGVTSSTFFVSLKCHRDCFYCFNPNQENYEYFREHTRDTIAELDALHETNPAIKHLALTGGEPLLFKDKTYRFFEHARQQFPGAHKRLYTCGDHIDVETLEHLQAAGLDEIRFSIRMHDLAKGQTRTYETIALAMKYVPNVMVEMPVLPDTLDEMKDVLLRLDALGIFGINLLEFCFPLNNVHIYREKGYKIKARPFRVLYNYWYAGGLPVAGSEEICLDLVEFALENDLKMGVHYCSLENKHTGQVYQQNNNRKNMPMLHFSQKDYFLKSAKVFGEEMKFVRSEFEKNGIDDYRVDEERDFMEFHIDKIKLLKKLDVEVGISINVLEEREGELFLRELKLDVTTPQTFRAADL
ncbi:MAG: radical SAM protein [Chloroflexota bacterium]